MTVYLSFNAGKLMRQILEVDEELHGTVLDPLTSSQRAELYFRGSRFPPNVSAYFFVFTHQDELYMAEVSLNGVPDRVARVTKSGLETVVERSSIGAYAVNPDWSHGEPEARAVSALDMAHRAAKRVAVPKNDFPLDNFKVLNSSKLRDIHANNYRIQDGKDIIPDQDSLTVVERLSYGCGLGCENCTNQTEKFGVVSMSDFRKESVRNRRFRERKHKSSVEFMREANALTTDIARLAWLYREGRTDLDVLAAGQLLRTINPEVTKLNAFIGTRYALAMSEDPDGEYALGDKKYSARFFKALAQAGYNRLTTGWERTRAKHDKFEEQALVARLIQEAGIKLKAVFIIGFGDSRYIDRVVKLANAAQPYRLEPSVIHPYFPGVGLKEPDQHTLQIADTDLSRVQKGLKAECPGKKPRMELKTGYERYLPVNSHLFAYFSRTM